MCSLDSGYHSDPVNDNSLTYHCYSDVKTQRMHLKVKKKQGGSTRAATVHVNTCQSNKETSVTDNKYLTSQQKQI